MVSFMVSSCSTSSLLMNNGILPRGRVRERVRGHFIYWVLWVLTPQFGEESIIDQFLNQAVIEKLFGLGLFRLGVGAADFVEGYLKSRPLDEGHFFHELVAVLEAALQHFLILNLGVLG